MSWRIEGTGSDLPLLTAGKMTGLPPQFFFSSRDQAMGSIPRIYTVATYLTPSKDKELSYSELGYQCDVLVDMKTI